MTTQEAIAKVRKLLALAKSDNAHEAAVALAAANRIIDAHRISLNDVAEADDPLVHNQAEPLFTSKRAAPYRAMLAQGLSRHYGCYVWINTGSTGKRWIIAGRTSDVEILRYTFAYVDSECVRIARKECRGKGRGYSRDYMIGFVCGVLDKLAESRKQTAEVTETGLVKLDSRRAQAVEFARAQLRKQGIVLKRTTTGGAINGEATSNGRRAGSSLHLGGAMGAGAGRLLNA
jgi:hypothetical protein